MSFSSTASNSSFVFLPSKKQKFISSHTTTSTQFENYFDNYVFHGCSMTGHKYMLDLTHDEICKQNPTPTDFCTPLSLLKRSQSEPAINQGCQTYFGLGSQCDKVGKDVKVPFSFSFSNLSDPNYEINASVSEWPRALDPKKEDGVNTDYCPICHISFCDHPFQHTESEWENHLTYSKVVTPDSILSDSDNCSSPVESLVL